MVTYVSMIGKVNETSLADALAYAEMAWDAMGYRTIIWDSNNNEIDYRFTSAGIAVVNV